MALKLNDHYLQKFIRPQEYANMQPAITAAHELLVSRQGPGNDFLGWVDLPQNYDKEEFARIKVAAEKIKKTC
jgi:glucose-6-phosphate isomerase